MDKIARIRAEIERRIDIIKPKVGQGFILCEQITRQLQDLLSFLNTLSEEPDKSLEEAVEKHINEALFKWSYDDEDGIVQYVHDSFIAGAEWQASQIPMPEDTVLFQKGVQEGRRLEREDMMKDCVTVECCVRVYPTLDDKPRPWVALYKNGIGCNSLRDIPELENIGFKDDDTAIVIIKRKEDGQ